MQTSPPPKKTVSFFLVKIVAQCSGMNEKSIYTETAKFLGLIWNEKLTWKLHINQLKTQRRGRIIEQIFSHLHIVQSIHLLTHGVRCFLLI